jgi:ABC-type bacteriocin/lantibiotic exporter with double-glycine peptidase domain
MQSYPFLWLPFAIVIGIPVLLVSPYLALIVLVFLVLALLAALAAAPYLLALYVARRWRQHRAAGSHDAWVVESQSGSAG